MSAPRTVMVVDDDEALRDAICELLEEDGFRTIFADSGSAALSRLRGDHEKPDVILVDLMMPGMNGWQFREEQLRDPELSKIPAVVMTASRELHGINANEVVYKPLKLKKLLAVIRRHMPDGPEESERGLALRETPALEASADGAAREHAVLFSGGGELGRRMAAIDWEKTPLGPVARWPQSLRTCVRIILTSRQPMFVWWGEQLINLYNDAYKSIIGGKHPEALGQPASTVWREIWNEAGPRAQTAMRENEGTYDEALLLIMERHGYQEETYYTFSYSPVPNDQGGTGGIICANTDDTQRIIGQRQLTLLREITGRTADLRTLKDVSDMSAVALATDGRDLPFALVYVMSSARTRFELCTAVGVDRGSAVAPEVVMVEDDSAWPLGHALREHATTVVSELASRFGALPSGAWDRPPSRAAVVPIVSGETGLAGALVVGLSPFRLFDDGYRGFLELVAAQLFASIANAQAHEEEKKRVESLAEIDRAKSAFFSNVSHEFRTPLTLMLGPTHDLLAGVHGPLADEQRAELEVLHRNGLRLQRLVNALLEFSRLEAGRTQASYELIDLAAVTREIAMAFESAVKRAGLSLVVDCSPLDAPVAIDQDMWEKIVLNLVSNALKFTFEGRIEVSLRAAGDDAVLRVKDTGVGIAADDLPRVFERFHRIEGTRARTHEGSGIGLALVQELVKLHDGSVGVESEVGGGTTFTVTIPQRRRSVPANLAPGPSRDRSAIMMDASPFVEEALRWLPGAETGKPASVSTPSREPVDEARGQQVVPARILLADDNADMRDYVRRHLERQWSVEVVEDGVKALSAARKNPPDLILTDVMMPGLDGFQLLHELRKDERTSGIPVVMLSARSGDEATVEGLQAGAEDYLTKPFSARELVARVRTHLELAGLRRAVVWERDRLRALLGEAPAMTNFLRGPDLVFEYAHPLTRASLGGRELVGRALLEAVPEWRDHDYPTLLRRVLQTGERIEGREKRRPGDVTAGHPRETYWDFVYVPVRDQEGTTAGVMSFEIEVTDQVLARRRVEASQEEFRRLLEHVQAGIAQTDLTGRITLVNDRYREIAGRSEAELLQLRLRDMTHPDDVSASDEALTRLVDEGTPFAIEKRYVKPDGSIVWVQSSVSRLDDREGRPRGVAEVTLDITKRKYAEQALEDVEREREARVAEMERAVRFSEMFVGILGHDLRNPLGAIMTSAGLLQLRETSDKVAKPVARILESADRMERMISQILDFTRIRLGRGIPLDRALVDLAELSRSIIEELEPVQNRTIRLDVRGDVIGTWDRDRLSQLLSNLAANACQHGLSERIVSLRLDGTSADRVRIEVNNGGTIPPDLLPLIFEPLRHSEERREKRHGASGLGLGLYISQQIVLAHDGTIVVDSNELRGTSFVVTLPRAPVVAGSRVFVEDGEPPLA